MVRPVAPVDPFVPVAPVETVEPVAVERIDQMSDDDDNNSGGGGEKVISDHILSFLSLSHLTYLLFLMCIQVDRCLCKRSSSGSCCESKKCSCVSNDRGCSIACACHIPLCECGLLCGRRKSGKEENYRLYYYCKKVSSDERRCGFIQFVGEVALNNRDDDDDDNDNDDTSDNGGVIDLTGDARSKKRKRGRGRSGGGGGGGVGGNATACNNRNGQVAPPPSPVPGQGWANVGGEGGGGKAVKKEAAKKKEQKPKEQEEKKEKAKRPEKRKGWTSSGSQTSGKKKCENGSKCKFQDVFQHMVSFIIYIYFF